MFNPRLHITNCSVTASSSQDEHNSSESEDAQEKLIKSIEYNSLQNQSERRLPLPSPWRSVDCYRWRMIVNLDQRKTSTITNQVSNSTCGFFLT